MATTTKPDSTAPATDAKPQGIVIAVFMCFLVLMGTRVSVPGQTSSLWQQVSSGNFSGVVTIVRSEMSKAQAQAQAKAVHDGTARATPSIAGGPHLSANCRAKLGGERILCAFEIFDPYGYDYGGAHQAGTAGIIEAWNAASTGGFSPGDQVVDCSSGIDAAVYGAYGVAENRLAQTFIYSRYWTQVPVGSVRAGDALVINTVNDQHIGLAVKQLGSGRVQVFDAESAIDTLPDGRIINRPAAAQIQYYNYNLSTFSYALRWVGPGAVA
jgi:hypothetical protein